MSASILAAALMLVPMVAPADGLWNVSAMLHAKKWVDLTHPFDADIPHWKGFDPLTRKVICDYDKDGFRAGLFCHVGRTPQGRRTVGIQTCSRSG